MTKLFCHGDGFMGCLDFSEYGNHFTVFCGNFCVQIELRCHVVLYICHKILCFTLSCRFNKLALNDDTVIDEVDHLVPVQVQPLANLCIKDVAFGVSHSAFLTGMGCLESNSV